MVLMSLPSHGSSRSFCNDLIYSVDQCVFVKPLSKTKRSLIVKLYPDITYLKFSLGRLHGSEYVFNLYLVKVENGALEERHLLGAVIPKEVYKEIISDEHAPKLLRDFLLLIPHNEPVTPPNTTYSCKGVKTIVEEIKSYLENYGNLTD